MQKKVVKQEMNDSVSIAQWEVPTLALNKIIIADVPK